MRRRARRDRYEHDDAVDLTPLIDVVFIMLIFFICTTSFVKESGVDIRRPTAESGEPKSESGIIFIGLDAGERIWIDNRQVDFRMLRPRVERMKSEVTSPSVVIQSDIGVSAGKLVQVMDQVRLAGIQEIALATKRKSQ